MSHPLTVLTRSFADTCNPQTMTLTQIDRLHTAIERVITDRPTHIDLLALDQLATQLNAHRRKRRLSRTGHIAGQLDMHGNEIAA